MSRFFRLLPPAVSVIIVVALVGATAACSAPVPPDATSASAPASKPAAAAACDTGWGSAEETAPAMGPAPVVAVRSGTDGCLDRVEFEVDGPDAGYRVSYVDVVVQDGSGAELPVPGAARLQVQLHHPAHDGAGQATLPGRAGEPLADVSGYPTLRSVVFGGSFEGYSTFGVGVRARLPFRVLSAPGPGGRARIVLEVAHRWS